MPKVETTFPVEPPTYQAERTQPHNSEGVCWTSQREMRLSAANRNEPHTTKRGACTPQLEETETTTTTDLTPTTTTETFQAKTSE